MDEPRKQPPPPNIPSEPTTKADESSLQRPEPPSQNIPQPVPPPPAGGPPPQIRKEAQPFGPEQKRTFLNRGEVRGMQKDMAQVREGEAKKERERIVSLKTQQEAQREHEAIEKIRASAIATKRQEETQRKQELEHIRNSILPPGEEQRVRNLPTPPSPGKKFFVRLLILIFFGFIALNLVLFAAWVFFFRDQAAPFQLSEIPFISQFFSQREIPTPPAPPEPLPPPPPEEPESPPPAGGPPSAITIEDALRPAHTATLQFDESGDLATLLEQFLQAEQRPAFTKILFRQKESNEFIESASAFFNLFGVTPPENLAPHFSQDTFFFLYSYERGNRFGMIMKTPSPQEARAALEQWESQVEQDLTPVMSFWDQKGSAYTTAWRSRDRHGVEIRFQTFSLSDYGIVYALVDNYVIFASSFEATADAIEALLSALESSDANTFKPPPPLSLQQALGQVLMIGFPDATLTQELKDTIKRLQPGGVLLLSRNIQDPEQLRQLTADLQHLSLEYSSLPLFIAVDQEGGAISRIDFGKEKTAQATIQDAEHAYQVGRLRAEELRSLGVNLNLSPVLDSTEPQDFLFGRTFQAGSLQTAQLAKAFLQGQKEYGILSTAKHFPGYGGIAFNPERTLAAVQDFPDISPFVFTLSAEPEFLLLSNVIYASLDPTRPFSFSPKGISLVRTDLNFQGIILTDDLTQPSLLNNYDLQTLAASPLMAGANMLMFSSEEYATKAHEALTQLASQDSSLRKNVEESAARILQLKKEFFFVGEFPASPEHLSQK
ncbi:MAG: hypothetical protein A3J30_03720 [Candidatus Wildermuthbacteria bacterium RIFCSPLOWO2_02_FULL_47_9c]|uniref:beta-N-acetylhexosaminidase n=2 Tax=Parcubacteria group TaxID=1794811 RepID=A0A837IM80_9BACT|nr:MAG: Beta-N-acetylhexosaminidase [Candidatus Yanofskybacteria bacterium GW2011_GWC1_48_11]KKW03919.1 MAG: Beta-N-acetylhexosaminidase [Parcubacteria group bacterium GW2011_GWB1_49_12]KKW08519.1 MAG: Beta-N-acetylhexosaminidase [Parcubacteria group bacterium GW2011_GWA1_49_26]KKW13995.1 MAG: Beta-N-acetylhexosaminidase [Parcubacteria group bacterium GW2011_GWA2_50_10]OHA61243.1 MAG: hypothetical protein A2109_03100 [Candidatus Wildermuthbacteria bacterium GWA1_49_26]OHA65399.1 MAG: hypotheti